MTGEYMRLNQALKNKLYDIRLRDKLLAEGKVTKQELEEYYNSLDDCTDKMTYTETDEPTEEEAPISE